MIYRTTILLAIGLAHGLPVPMTSSTLSMDKTEVIPSKHSKVLSLYADELADPYARSRAMLLKVNKMRATAQLDEEEPSGEDNRKETHRDEAADIKSKHKNLKDEAEAALKQCQDCKAEEDKVILGYKKLEDAHGAAEAAADAVLTADDEYDTAKTGMSKAIIDFEQVMEEILSEANNLGAELKVVFEGVVADFKAVLGDAENNHKEKETETEAKAKLTTAASDSKKASTMITEDLIPKLQIVKEKEEVVRGKKEALDDKKRTYNEDLEDVHSKAESLKKAIKARNDVCEGADIEAPEFKGSKYDVKDAIGEEEEKAPTEEQKEEQKEEVKEATEKKEVTSTYKGLCYGGTGSFNPPNEIKTMTGPMEEKRKACTDDSECIAYYQVSINQYGRIQKGNFATSQQDCIDKGGTIKHENIVITYVM